MFGRTLLRFAPMLVILIGEPRFSVGELVIRLPTGEILGRQDVTLENKQYYAFEGIPYGTPPVGDARFNAPQPADKWDEVLNTTYQSKICYQRGYKSKEVGASVVQSEDCLNLNVYTPLLPSDNSNTSLPVMFFIYGGGFIVGSTTGYYPDLFMNNDVILVTVNYRVGIFGFLSTQDDVIPGNNGLKDQQLALEWTHNNIELFGGDPQKITIFGQSAGSASCAYQLLNLRSTGLFQSAILESGSFLSPWAFQRRARRVAFATAALLNSTFESNNDSQALLEFFLTVEADDLNDATQRFFDKENTPEDIEIAQGFYFAPVIEVKNPTAFLTKNMYGLLQAGNIIKVPTMIGITSEENLLFNQDEKILRSDMQTFDEHLDWLVPWDMQIRDQSDRLKVGDLIRQIYTGGEPLADHIGDGVRYHSDNSFTRSIIKHAEIYSQFAETFFYEISYHGDLYAHPRYEGAEYSPHGEEIPYLFCSGNNCDLDSYPKDNQVFREVVVKLWTDFAKYQNPTPEVSDLLQNISWPQVSTDSGDFLYLNIDQELSIRNQPKAETYQAWNHLYAGLNFSDFDTY